MLVLYLKEIAYAFSPIFSLSLTQQSFYMSKNSFFSLLIPLGPRYRKPKTPKVKGDSEEKRPRTAFSSEQLARLKVFIFHSYDVFNDSINIQYD